jgi:isochorismate pyruvate lyase
MAPRAVAKCSTLDEVRANIDRLDRQIVSLLAERGDYVLQAAGLKESIGDVSAPQRVEAVIRNVRRIAVETGALPDVVEEAYRPLLRHSSGPSEPNTSASIPTMNSRSCVPDASASFGFLLAAQGLVQTDLPDGQISEPPTILPV